MKNYYQVLGVTESASEDEIRSGYRRLLQESLMDKDRFDAIKEAFEALRTPERRAEYDRSLRSVSTKPLSAAADDAKKTGTARLSKRSQDLGEKTQALVAVACPVCGHRNAAGESYCAECGFLLGSRADGLSDAPDLTHRPHLVSESGKIYPLRTGVNTVGRETGDIVLPDKTVSRHHAQLVYDEDRGIYSVEDTDSTNGTHVNSQRLLPRIPHPVLPGDDIQFGSVPLKLVAYEKTAVLEDDGEAEEPEAAPIAGMLRLARGAGIEEIALVLGNNTIGRMPDNTICIRNDRYISGHHSRIEADPRFFRLVDLGSTNGTYLNGLRLTTNEAIAISDGDEITLGGTVYTFHRADSASVAAAAAAAAQPTVPMNVVEPEESEVEPPAAEGPAETAAEASA